MKFRVETKALLSVVNNVSKVIDKLSVLPALANLKIVAEESSVVITGSNGTASIQQTLPVELGIERIGMCLVDSKYFSEIIRKVNGEFVDIECVDNLMHIKSGKAKFKLTCTDVSEYPSIDLERPVNKLFCPTESLRAAFERVLICVANGDNNRPVLNGVHLRVDSGQVTIIGSDSYRVNQYAFIDMDCKDAKITIPRQACIEFLKTFKDDVTVYYDDKKIQFVSDYMTYQSQLLIGVYPDVGRIIPQNRSGQTL